MAHVTFIHGIDNKPEPAVLLDQWRVSLLDNDGVDLDEAGVSMSMVYWADMLNEEPAPTPAAHEDSDSELQQSASSEAADLSWLEGLPPDQREFVNALAQRSGLDPFADDDDEDAGIVVGSALEAVPLPGFIKKPLMRIFLRDVHHYLYNVAFSPRPGETYRLRRDIRQLTLDSLLADHTQPGPHVVVAHSLGTVIAYDVLTAVGAAPPIDALITLGSPLGMSEIQEALTPPWTRRSGWPERCLGSGSWRNVSDRLDPVCGADPVIANDFRRQGSRVVQDVIVSNNGRWRHAVTKYLGQAAVRDCLRETLGEDLF